MGGQVDNLPSMVSPLSVMADDDFEQLAYRYDAPTGLRAIVAIHSTVLGPGLGGTRFWPYVSEEEALIDVTRLAKGMTYKHAAAGLHQGGGKAVIIGDPAHLRSDELILAYGRFVEGLAGRYVTAEDIGTTQADMNLIGTVTSHVAGRSEALGGSGDPSPATALGLVWAMQAVAERLWGEATLADRHVCIAGVGKVGGALADHLHAQGARLTVADIHPGAVAAVVHRTGAAVVDPDGAHAVEADLFAPCALGAGLSAVTIPELGCQAIVGSANNQLATAEDAQRIQDSGVLYAPDYIVNAGGVINIAEEKVGYERDRANQQIARIHDTVLTVFDLAESAGITTAAAADRLAEQRLTEALNLRRESPGPGQ